MHDKPNAFMARPMLARRSSDAKGLSGDADLSLLPVRESENTGSRREVLCAVTGGEDVASIEKLATELIEIVRVVLVTQKNRIDVRKLAHLQGRVVMHLERWLTGHAGPFTTGRREEGVSEKGDAIDVEDRCGSSDMRNADLVLEGRNRHGYKCLLYNGAE
jgi:hypothetical protein